MKYSVCSAKTGNAGKTLNASMATLKVRSTSATYEKKTLYM